MGGWLHYCNILWLPPHRHKDKRWFCVVDFSTCFILACSYFSGYYYSKNNNCTVNSRGVITQLPTCLSTFTIALYIFPREIYNFMSSNYTICITTRESREWNNNKMYRLLRLNNLFHECVLCMVDAGVGKLKRGVGAVL